MQAVDLTHQEEDSCSVHSVSSTGSSYNLKPPRETKRKKTPTTRPFNLPSSEPNIAIAMLVEESLLTSDFQEALQKEFYDVLLSNTSTRDREETPSSSSSAASNNNNNNNNLGAFYQGSGNNNVENAKKYTYVPLTTPLPGLVHWIKCDHCRQLQALINGAQQEDESDFVVDKYSRFVPFMEHVTLLVVPADEFCERILPSDRELCGGDVSCEFPRLDDWMARTHGKLMRQQSTNVKNPYQPRLVFAFIDLDKACLKVQRKINKEGRPIAFQERVEQALIHLTIIHDVEIFRCKTVAQLCEQLNTLTRVLETNVEKPNMNALDCVMKASKQKLPDDLSLEETAKFELQQTWMAMLQMVPLLSKEKAIAFVQNPEFSCVKRVYEAMTDEGEPEKKRLTLLQNNFGKTKSGAVRNESKLAKHIYRLMTVDDPDALIQEEQS